MKYKYVGCAGLFNVNDMVKNIHIILEREVRRQDYLLGETNAVANIYYCR